jgi:hypothetical protein
VLGIVYDVAVGCVVDRDFGFGCLNNVIVVIAVCWSWRCLGAIADADVVDPFGLSDCGSGFERSGSVRVQVWHLC